MPSRFGCLLAVALLVGACTSSGPPTPEVDAATAAEPTVAATSTPVVPTPMPTAQPGPTPTAPRPTPVAQEAETVEPTPEPTPSPQPTPSPEPTPGPDCVRVTDFATDAENNAWFVVNDNVMGGQSSGGPTFSDSAMIFEGAINTNGGGFSSVRIQLRLGAFEGYTHLQVRARTDGRPYKVTLEDSLPSRDRRVSQQAPLTFEGTSEWQTAQVSFSDLSPRIFGRDVVSEAFRPDLADQLGIMLSDGVDGPFRLEIDWIDVCRSPESV